MQKTESIVKLLALKGGASRQGSFLLYGAPWPRPKGRGLRGTYRSKRGGYTHGDRM